MPIFVKEDAMLTWHRDANTFARRVVHENKKSLLSSGFIVEQGTKALFFENGVLKEIVGAGKIELGGWLERVMLLDFSRNVEIVVCDAGDVHFEYIYGSNGAEGVFSSPIRTEDSVMVQVGMAISLQIESPELFMLHVFKGKEELGLLELKNRYQKEIRDSLVEVVSRHKVEELNPGRGFKNSCLDAMEKHLETSLQREGFRLIQICSLSFYNPQIEALQNQKADIKILYDRQNLEIQAQKIELEGKDILLGHLRKETEQKIEKDKIGEQYAQATQDRELARIQKKQDGEFEEKKKSIVQNAELKKLDYELIGLQQREEEKQRDRDSLEQKLSHVKNDLEIKKIQIEMTKLDMEIAELNEERAHKHKQKRWAIERENREEMLRMEREDEILRQNARLAQEIQGGQARVGNELQITQAQTFSELEKLKLHKEMTPEQLMSLASFSSPAAAQSMGEKFKSQAEALEERNRAMREMMQKQIEATNQMALNYGNQMAQVAKSYASQKCHFCSKEIQPGWKLCPYCGKSL